MTDLNLPALREAVAKMTEGPWTQDIYVYQRGAGDRWRGIVGPDGELVARVGDCGEHEGFFHCQKDADNLDGIVALRNAAPALLDEVEVLRAGRCCHNVPMGEPCAECRLFGQPKDEQVRALLDELERLRSVEADFHQLSDVAGWHHGEAQIALARAEKAEADLALKENARRGLALSLENAEAELAAARKVLETAIELPGYCAYAVIGVDAAAWQAWQARAGKEQG